MVFHLTLRTKVAIVSFEAGKRDRRSSGFRATAGVSHKSPVGSDILCESLLRGPPPFVGSARVRQVDSPGRHSALLKLDQMHQDELFGNQTLVKPSGKAELILRKQRRRGKATCCKNIPEP